MCCHSVFCRHWKQEAGGGRWVLRDGRQALTGGVGKAKLRGQKTSLTAPDWPRAAPDAWIQTANSTCARNIAETLCMGGQSWLPVTFTWVPVPFTE